MKLKTNVRSRGVGHEHGDGERAHPSKSLVLLDVPLPEQRVQTTDSSGHRDDEPVRVDTVVHWVAVLIARQRQSGIGPRLPCCDERQLAGTVQPTGPRAGDVVTGLVNDLSCEGDRKTLGPLVVKGVDAVTSFDKPLPRARGVRPQRCGGSESGDDDVGHVLSSADGVLDQDW
jgi:hypothetical protein